MPLLVKEILKRPFFKNTEVLAGKNGLNREVNWAHIVEVAKFGHLLNGKEVIFSTGIGWAHDEKKSLSYLQQLLDYHASALFVELVVHVNSLPEKMLTLAEEQDFPIIVFKEEVKFIDITKDLQELILGYHESIWWKLESLYNVLNRKLLSDGNIGDFLKVLHKKTKKQIILQYEGQYRFFPSPTKKKQLYWIKTFHHKQNHNFYEQPIYLFQNKIATLYLIDDDCNLTQFDELALKRCSEILGQYFWKHHLQKEAHQIKRNEWILEAIAGKLSHEEIVKNIHHQSPGILIKEAIIAVKPFQKLLINEKSSSSEAALLLLLRPILLEYGFQLLTVKDFTRNIYILLLINQQSDKINERLIQALKTVLTNHYDPLIQTELQWLSFGKTITSYHHLGKSYETALATLSYQQNIEMLDEPFYESLATYRIIDQMTHKEELKEIIKDYLNPILLYDQEKGTELLKTLEVYFNNLGSKNETAEELHIVRQTLYHRLNRIESLIGDDFMTPKKRFMIEFSIQALKYINFDEIAQQTISKTPQIKER